jgi:hypothetical protein
VSLNPHIVAQFHLRTGSKEHIHVGVVAVIPRNGECVTLPDGKMYLVDGVVHDLRYEKEACSGKLMVYIWVQELKQ